MRRAQARNIFEAERRGWKNVNVAATCNCPYYKYNNYYLLRINRMQQHAFYSTKEFGGVIKVSDICRELPQGRYIVFSKAEEGVSVATLYDVYNCPLHIFLVYGEGARRSNRSF